MTAPAFNTENFGLVDELAQHEARESFWTYRQYMNPKMIWGWWQREVALELHRFWIDYLAGKRPKLLLQSPPQHGKANDFNTLCLTSRGWKRFGQIQIGDLLFHPSGKMTRVLAFSADCPIRMRVELTNGEVIWCHKQHDWTVLDKNSKPRGVKQVTLETQELLRLGVMESG